ncbi:MAG: methionyl-tRNA formyltransferase [Kiritimatiellae bacterium]|nr:methionyl-tRNA formyltransferase [Kiritimatiellia bacterium]
MFFGSGDFACPILEALLSDRREEVVGVVTRPDRPAGRGRRPTPCAVRVLAEAQRVPVRTPERVNVPEEVAAIGEWAPDLVVVADYGAILKPPLLSLPRLGGINVHPSLLPKYRGAAPIPWAIANGETLTGVTVQFLAERMDAGDIILAESEPIGPDDTAATLQPRLAALGARLLLRALALFERPPVPRTPQDESAATYAPKIRKEDGLLDWNRPAEELRNRIRAFVPWPRAFTWLPGSPPMRLQVLAARVESGRGVPGELLELGREGPLVATGEQALRLLRVQPEGRAEMSGGEFARGCRIATGTRLG